MRLKLNKFLKYWPVFLAVVGPGIITAVADNDAGGVATYTVAAAMYGMASQYLVVPTTFLLALTQGIGAKLAIVTGKGLGALIRENYGVRVSVVIFLIYFVVNQGVVLQNISGLKASLQLFNAPWQLSLILACLALTVFVIVFNFKSIQRVFLFMILFYIAYVVSAFLAGPNWGQAARESFVWPRLVNVWDARYWFSLIAVLGTTITAWGQFFVASFIVDKGTRASQLKAEQAEIYGGALVTNFFSWMIALSVTYTLFAHKIVVSSAGEAALAMAPFAGKMSSFLFAGGLFGASLLGLTIVPLATAYVFTEMLGFERTLNSKFKSGRPFYIFFMIQILIGLLAALLPSTNLFTLTLYADFLNGAMLPIIFYFLIRFSEDKAIMGERVSGRVTRFIIRLAAILIILAVVVTFVGKIFGL
ncbi:MAG: divalent metal cation transporter [Candidatus Magasanikbacteria bacterium]|nr:divalent metal cation transporter [Candidatus Magasanikbacteria bacterium]